MENAPRKTFLIRARKKTLGDSPHLEKPKAGSLGRDAAWNTLGSLFYAGCNWVITVLAVILSNNYEASGSLSVAMAVGNIFSIIVGFKARTIQTSDLNSTYLSSDYVCLRIICLVFAFILAFPYSFLSVAPNDYLPVFSFLLFKAGESFVDVYHGISQRHNRFDYIGISQIIRGVLAVASFSIGMLFTQNLTASILLMAFSTIAAVVAYDIPRARRYERVTPRFKPVQIRSLFHICLPGFISTIIYTAVVSLTRQCFGMEYGNEYLGIYAAVATPAVIVQALVNYIFTPLTGPIAKAWNNQDRGSLLKYLFEFAGLLLAVTLGCVLLFSLAGEPALCFLYGESISSYSYLMTPLLVSTSLTAAMAFVLNYLVIVRNFSGAITAASISLAFCFVIMHPAFVVWGMNGISMTISLSFSVGLITAGLFILKPLKDMNPRN